MSERFLLVEQDVDRLLVMEDAIFDKDMLSRGWSSLKPDLRADLGKDLDAISRSYLFNYS